MRASQLILIGILLLLLVGGVQASTTVWSGVVNVTANITQTETVVQVVKPVVQGNTSVDNIDQSLDPGWAAASAYVLTNAVNEGATHIQTVTPTKKLITNITVNVVDAGDAVTWYLVVHDASNNALASSSMVPPGTGAQSFAVPCLWNTGNLHFHVYASATTGAPTLKAASDDLEGGSYIQYYAKNTEDTSITVNGVQMNLTVGYGNYTITPLMTSNTAPAPFGIAGVPVYLGDESTYGAWRLFNGELSTSNFWAPVAGATNAAPNYWILKLAEPQVLRRYGIVPYDDGSIPHQMPINWTISGSSDNSTFTILDDKYGIRTQWIKGKSLEYVIPNTQAYQYYKFSTNFTVHDNTTPNANDGLYPTYLQEFYLFEGNNADGLLSGAIVDTDTGLFSYENGFNATKGKFSDVFTATDGGYGTTPTVINNWGWTNTAESIQTASDTTARSVTFKLNTMLNVTGVNITATAFNNNVNTGLVEISGDNITYSTVIDYGANVAAQTVSASSNFVTGNSTFYVRLSKDTTNGYIRWDMLNVTALIGTSSLPVQSTVVGTNYYNISSNGMADSASLDPSMRANVWLMGQGSSTTIPIVQFVTSKTVVMFPGRLYFNDTSLNTPTMWNWSTGDGKWFNTTDANAGLNLSYQYTKRGLWIANLTVGNSAGTNTSALKSKSIRVIGYQGFEIPIPTTAGKCVYSTSRPLDLRERMMTDCSICAVNC